MFGWLEAGSTRNRLTLGLCGSVFILNIDKLHAHNIQIIRVHDFIHIMTVWAEHFGSPDLVTGQRTGSIHNSKVFGSGVCEWKLSVEELGKHSVPAYLSMFLTRALFTTRMWE